MKWGPGELTAIPQSRHSSNLIMTAPKTDAIDLDPAIVEKLSDKIDPALVKKFYTINKRMIRPGTYLTGDAGAPPLGMSLLRDIDNNKLGNVAEHLLYPEKSTLVARQGLSPDSYSSIVRQGLRDGNSLRYGTGFIK